MANLVINQPNQVWCADITYLPLANGFMYLVAIMDWFSRFVLSWQLSNTLDAFFCQLALEQALESGCNQIFNTDQGSQFTAHDFTAILLAAGIRISMDGRGHFWDNIFIERLWRSLKYEEVYLREYAEVADLQAGLEKYLTFYAVDLARAAERAGFDALLNNDIPAARAQFNKAYTAYPQFHNVDEIRRKLDTVRHEDPAAIARVKSSIVNENAWRMPEEVRQHLLQQTQLP